LNVAAEQVVEHSSSGVLLERIGNRSREAVPQNMYRCDRRDHGDPEWILISIDTDEQWRGLLEAMGAAAPPALAALRTRDVRRGCEEAIDDVVGAWTSRLTAWEVADALAARGVPAGPVLPAHRAVDLVQLEYRGFFEELEHPVTGVNLHSALPARFSTIAGPVHRRAAPMLGEHNREVLGDLLGLDDAAINDLERLGVIGTVVTS
jgi:crotonobetainyl-CoA:carnitine CoA-transferase CaiB-like acyl-CoA transferase